MAKKNKRNNKTDHVLGLLSGGNETKDDTNSWAEPSDSRKPEPARPSVQVVAAQEDEEIANTVKEMLEEELEAALESEEGMTDAIFSESGGQGKTDGASGEAAEGGSDGQDVLSEEKGEAGQTAGDGESVPDDADKGASDGTKTEETVSGQGMSEEDAPRTEEEEAQAELEEAIKFFERDTEKAKEEALPDFDEDEETFEQEEALDDLQDGFGADHEDGEKGDYLFVNVMEKLVRDKVGEYMDEFGNCTCSRCVSDTMALTLTHLAPKYVVVGKNAIAPLMNYYTQKYSGLITVEITKACIRVREYPHHGRD